MKRILLIILIALAPTLAFAKFNAGISIGYNTTDLTTNWDEINNKLKSGFQFGIFMRMGDQFFIQPEIHYASRGGFTEFQSEVLQQLGSGTEFHTGMVQIPVIAGLKIIDGDMLGVNLQAGPVMSIIVDKGLAGVGEVFSTSSLKDFTYGVQLGLGVEFLSLSLNARYEYLLSDVYDGIYGNQNFKARSNTFMVTLGWKIL